MLPYSATCITARVFFQLCIVALVSAGLLGCSGADYPEGDGGQPLEPGEYQPVEARYICGASQACEEYGSCCNWSANAACVKICGTCSDKDTLEPSFQCYPTNVGGGQ